MVQAGGLEAPRGQDPRPAALLSQLEVPHQGTVNSSQWKSQVCLKKETGQDLGTEQHRARLDAPLPAKQKTRLSRTGCFSVIG